MRKTFKTNYLTWMVEAAGVELFLLTENTQVIENKARTIRKKLRI
jgi:hypothetical protein